MKLYLRTVAAALLVILQVNCRYVQTAGDNVNVNLDPLAEKYKTENTNHVINPRDVAGTNSRPVRHGKIKPRSREHSKLHHRSKTRRGTPLEGSHYGLTSPETQESRDHKNLEALLTMMKTYGGDNSDKQLGGDFEEWTTWGSWGACSKTCGPGITVRIRTCSGGKCRETSELAQQECRLADCATTAKPSQPATTEAPCEYGILCEQERMYKYLKKEVKELLEEDRKLLQTTKGANTELAVILGGTVILILGIILLCIIRCVDRKMEENKRIKREAKRKQKEKDQVGVPSTSRSFTSMK
ncbi:circumsporozoite protein-like [Branchiostoma floridae]|uniref:Circumsporozoite protein-like n=2 Tax=Branchiostoma floridae TaxID=7739 RepID=A0A9J7MAH1_BRAFL|nr:circumsporozoite protein-like [Branchiostoma floridae]